jgi:hypothetical protein
MAWRQATSLITLRTQINTMWPNRSRASDGGIGDATHQAEGSASYHNPWIQNNGVGVVTAYDFTHDPDNGADMQYLADVLLFNEDARVKYVIWNRRIWVAPFQAWQRYNGSDPHTNHLHISVATDPNLYDDASTWNLTKQEANMPTLATQDMVDSLAHAFLNDSYANNPGLAQYVGQPVENVITAFNNAEQRANYLKSIDMTYADNKKLRADITSITGELTALKAMNNNKITNITEAVKTAEITAPVATKAKWYQKLLKALGPK